MPLPTDTPLSLQGFGAAQSKPKQAVIVRMSAETLDALDSLPVGAKIEFQSGDGSTTAGLRIGDRFFPIQGQSDTSSHDIYLRTALANRQNAPLKLHASVSGLFRVQPQLDDVTTRIKSINDAHEQKRKERRVVMIDDPPTATAAAAAAAAKTGKSAGGGAKKAKTGAAAFLKPSKPTTIGHSRSPSGSGRVSPMPAQAPTSAAAAASGTKDDVVPLRRRMVHCLAVKSRSTEEIMRLMGGNKDDVLAMLNEVAEPEPVPKKSADKAAGKLWRLKRASWLDVRPYEWRGLSEQERITMARQARIALKDLNVPESDPAWAHIKFRTTSGAVAAGERDALPPAPATAPRKDAGASNAAAVAAKKKPRAKVEVGTSRRANDEPIMMKDESRKASQLTTASNSTVGSGVSLLPPKPQVQVQVRPRLSTNGSKASEAPSSEQEEGEIKQPQPPKPARRLPGSGYKAPSPTTPSHSQTGSGRGTPTPAPTQNPPTGVPQKRLGPVDARSSKQGPGRTESPLGREREKPAPPIPPPARRTEKEKAEREREREKEARAAAREDRERKAREEEKKAKEEAKRAREEKRAQEQEEAKAQAKAKAQAQAKTQARDEKREREEKARVKEERERERSRVKEETPVRSLRDEPPPRAKTKTSDSRLSLLPRPKQEDKELRLSASNTSLKRKKTAYDDDDDDEYTDTPRERKRDAATKRRKTGEAAPTRERESREVANLKSEARRRESSPRVRESPAPLPPTLKQGRDRDDRDRDGERSKPRDTERDRDRERDRERERERERRSTSTTKLRRLDHIYTSSSESESESPPTKKAKPHPPTARHHDAHARRAKRTLPTDRAGLTNLYHKLYPRYLGLFQKVVAQKAMAERGLSGYDSAWSRSTSDDDDGSDDGEMMDAEELYKLSDRYSKMRDEMESILRAYHALGAGSSDGTPDSG